MCTVHADSSAGVFGRLQMYLAMTRERFEPEAANLMVSQGIDCIIHVAKLSDGTRSLTSVREVTGAEGETVLSNEIYGPGETGRAVAQYRFSETRMSRLEHAGFDRRWLDTPGKWYA
jgi:pilus assembly protein CpaF